MKRAFLTGGSGFVGANLARALVESGYRVTALHRKNSNLAGWKGLEVEPVEGDLTDLASVQAALPTAVDVVFHVAGNSSFWPAHHARQYRDNVLGTRNLLQAALGRDAGRFIFTSTAGAFGLQPTRLHEAAPRLGSTSWIGYVRTKALAEEEVRKAAAKGLKTVILNPGTIIGPLDVRNWGNIFLQVNAGKLRGVAPGGTSFCHVREVVKAHLAAAQKSVVSDSYLLGGADATFLEALTVVARLVGRKAPSRPTPAWVVQAVGRLSLWASYFTRREPALTPEGVAYLLGRNSVSSDLAIRELDYQPVSLEEMLTDCHGWLVAQGLLSAGSRGGE